MCSIEKFNTNNTQKIDYNIICINYIIIMKDSIIQQCLDIHDFSNLGYFNIFIT
jgi:hypothetical protein